MDRHRKRTLTQGQSYSRLHGASSSAPLTTSKSSPSFTASGGRPRVHFSDTVFSKEANYQEGLCRDETMDYLTMRRPSNFTNDPELDEVMRHYGIDQTQGDGIPTTTSIPKKPEYSEHSQRLAAFGVSLSNKVSNAVFAYPFLVLRRQCQVNSIGRRFHLTPFSLVGVALNLQRAQGITCLWKGIGSSFMVSGITLCAETAISEASHGKLPHDVATHPSVQSLTNHILLKTISSAIVAPFYAAHLVESVQSEMVSDPPGLFSCLVDGITRMFGRHHSPRMLPLRKILIPHLSHVLIRYLLATILQRVVLHFMHWYARRIHNDGRNTQSTGSLSSSLPPSVWSTDGTEVKTFLTNHYPELVSGFLADLMCDIVLYPMETVMHRITIQGTRTIIDNTDTGVGFLPVASKYDGFVDCLSTVIETEGYSGLYRGFGALILQYGLKYSIIRFTKFILRVSSPAL